MSWWHRGCAGALASPSNGCTGPLKLPFLAIDQQMDDEGSPWYALPPLLAADQLMGTQKWRWDCTKVQKPLDCWCHFSLWLELAWPLSHQGPLHRWSNADYSKSDHWSNLHSTWTGSCSQSFPIADTSQSLTRNAKVDPRLSVCKTRLLSSTLQKLRQKIQAAISYKPMASPLILRHAFHSSIRDVYSVCNEWNPNQMTLINFDSWVPGLKVALRAGLQNP